MESHWSSASFSSSSYSRFSHEMTPSSSFISSPSSSRDSPASSQPSLESSAIAGAASINVPFLWEEKPGVRKQTEIQKETRERDERRFGQFSHNPSSWTLAKDFSEADFVASKIIAPAWAAVSTPENHLPLSPPPRLLAINSLPANSGNHHHRKLNHVGQASPSSSFHRRRHGRDSSQLDDDPFLLAMVVCTNEDKVSSKGGGAGRNGGGGGLTKKIREHSVHFDQCIPRRALSSTGSSKDRGKARADRQNRTTSSVVEVGVDPSYARFANNKGSQGARQRDKAKVKRSADKAIMKEGKPIIPPRSGTAHTHPASSRSVDDIRLQVAGKELKATLNTSKAGLHSRRCCNDLPPPPPSVNLSCGLHAKSFKLSSRSSWL